MKKTKNLIPAVDEIVIAVFKNDTGSLVSLDLMKIEDAKDYEDELISKYGYDNFEKNYISFAIDSDNLDLIMKAGMIPIMKIMAENAGYEESQEDKDNFEYYYGKSNKEIN